MIAFVDRMTEREVAEKVGLDDRDIDRSRPGVREHAAHDRSQTVQVGAEDIVRERLASSPRLPEFGRHRPPILQRDHNRAAALDGGGSRHDIASAIARALATGRVVDETQDVDLVLREMVEGPGANGTGSVEVDSLLIFGRLPSRKFTELFGLVELFKRLMRRTRRI